VKQTSEIGDCVGKIFMKHEGARPEGLYGIDMLPSLLKTKFLADRTNGRAIATLLRLSSSVVVCDVMYCG